MYAKVTGTTVDQFPYSKAMLKADNPNVSFPSNLTLDDAAPYGAVLVTQQADPAYDRYTEYLVQGVPVFNGPNWEVTQVVTAMTQPEIDEYAKQEAIAEDTVTLENDPQVANMLKKRPDEINAYIDTNVTDMDSAKEAIKVLARAIAVVGANVFN
jgi:hypothetical protein